MSQAGYRMMEYRGLALREDPAREECFRIVHQHHEVFAPTEEALFDATGREGIHTLMNSEVLSLEIAAQSIVDFPDAPWELRMALARIAWDETRHTRMCLERLRALGGSKGMFPIINHEYNVVCRFDSLAARLSVQNRTFEAGSMESFPHWMEVFEQRGDAETVAVFDTIMCDELSHARIGNDWVRQLVKDEPREALEVARAMAFLKGAVEALRTQPGECGMEIDSTEMKEIFALKEDVRRASGFSDTEIEELRRQDRTVRGVDGGAANR
jgi:uncharacterized ferritin-like protein (DUF455 family)